MVPKHLLQFAFSIGLAALAGCAHSRQTEDGKAVLHLWKATHGETRHDWDSLLVAFERAHPHLRVDVLSHPWNGWDERYAAAFAGGNPPDVSYMPDEFWPRYAAAGMLAPLDTLFPGEIASMAAQYPPNLWQLGQFDGHQYALPFMFVSYQLFDAIFMLTSGGPANRSVSIVYYVYRNAFHFDNLGYASTMSVLLFAVVMTFTLIQLRLARRGEEE